MKQSSALTAELVKLAHKNDLLDKVYGQEVNRLLRLEYSLSEELALLWAEQEGQKLDEIVKFKAYREDCKVRAKATVMQLLGNTEVSL